MQKLTKALMLSSMILAVSLASCTPAGVKGVRAFEDLPPAQGEVVSDAEFLYELSNKKYCSTDDAYRGILYFVDGADTSSNFQERTARVQMHGLAKADWKHTPQAPITKGKVAYMFARALEFPGGVMYNITDAGSRYALRELIYKDIIRIGSEGQAVSGAEYVGILGRADDYRLAAGERGKGPFPNWPFISD
ncbi:MAG: hypothetical protein GWP14_09385 [Actinobacteria bacterium]|nr:hypothetical protein [Actinomycetota bacterium]